MQQLGPPSGADRNLLSEICNRGPCPAIKPLLGEDPKFIALLLFLRTITLTRFCAEWF